MAGEARRFGHSGNDDMAHLGCFQPFSQIHGGRYPQRTIRLITLTKTRSRSAIWSCLG